MLYYLFEYLEQHYQFPGAGLFQFITFRAAMAVLFSLLISMIYGRRIINYLQAKQVGETVRDLGLQGQSEKAGTPTMGGIIIILATLIPVLLFAKLENIYIIMLLASTVWMGIIGFLDDYIKVFKKDKEGLKGRFKVLGQIGLGILVGATMFFHEDITIKEELKSPVANQEVIVNGPAEKEFQSSKKSTKTTIPFTKNNEFDYTSAISVLTLGIFAFVSGNIIFSDYLNIMYIPNVGEITIYIAAFTGALIGFLWYNTYPAQVFMGDTGSLTIGGIIAVLAIVVRKEWLIPILCGIFLAENVSVIMQVGWFKYTKKKYGEGRRIFLMSPLHHHYQKKGYHESKIVSRFWIIGILLAILAVVTLKLR